MKLFNLSSFTHCALTVMLGILIMTSSTANAARNGKIGGNGGQAQTINCPRDQYAVGMSAMHNNKIIMRIRLLCSEVNRYSGSAVNRRDWSTESRSSRPGGNAGLRRSTFRCPMGQFLASVVKGYSGKAFLTQTVVSGLKVKCVRFSNINTRNGTSRKQVGGYRDVGAKFSGPSQIAGDYYTQTPDFVMKGLVVKSRYALDSVMVNGKIMPWYLSRTQQNSNNTQQANIPRRAIGISNPQSAQRPDLYASLRPNSAVWRYGRTFTTTNGARIRQVSDVFCRSDMRQSSDKFGAVTRTKTFNLPNIQYEIVNAGGTTTTPSLASEQFIQNNPGITIPGMRSGQRINRTIRRTRQVQRCVVTGTNFGSGCYECPRSSTYQDPILRIQVDTGDSLTESNENNNVLRK